MSVKSRGSSLFTVLSITHKMGLGCCSWQQDRSGSDHLEKVILLLLELYLSSGERFLGLDVP